MPEPLIQICAPEPLGEFVETAPLQNALTALAALVGNRVEITRDDGDHGDLQITPAADASPQLAAALQGTLGHMLDREQALNGVTRAMLESFEELNLLYELIPSAATKTNPAEIAQWLVDEAARILRCRRVSLLMVEENQDCLRLVASRGLPADIPDVAIPISGTIAGHVLQEKGLLVCNHSGEVPAFHSLGTYDSDVFAVVRVPLVARGRALGVLTATERDGDAEFTARDQKLLQSLSTVSASALLNCRLHESVTQQMLSTIRALASAVDAKDHYTHDHSTRVGQLCVATARELGIRGSRALHLVELSGLLHDVGKIGVPDAILAKQSGLSEEEYLLVQDHTQIGARIVSHVQGLEEVTEAVLHHHERYDGLGYPAGLRGDEIPLKARMISVADVYDCITSDRPYRKGSRPAEALRELQAHAGTQFDPEVVAAFVRVIEAELHTRPADPVPTG